jgi:hypothetical protein
MPGGGKHFNAHGFLPRAKSTAKSSVIGTVVTGGSEKLKE